MALSSAQFRQILLRREKSAFFGMGSKSTDLYLGGSVWLKDTSPKEVLNCGVATSSISGWDVHKEAISIAFLKWRGKLVMGIDLKP